MLAGACHCGKVRVEVPDPPAALIHCNCSICRRNGARWAFYPKADVRIAGHPAHTTGYRWGAQTIETFRCAGCGSVTHWEPLAPDGERLGVNMRNFDPAALADVRVRRFDGADTWSYLD